MVRTSHLSLLFSFFIREVAKTTEASGAASATQATMAVHKAQVYLARLLARRRVELRRCLWFCRPVSQEESVHTDDKN